jgi:hypothetical protein
MLSDCTDGLGWDTANNCVRRNVLGDDGSSRYHRAFPNSDSIRDNGPGP